jgi:hypothetical protein
MKVFYDHNNDGVFNSGDRALYRYEINSSNQAVSFRRLKEEDSGFMKNTQYSYSSDPEKVTITYPSGGVSEYKFDHIYLRNSVYYPAVEWHRLKENADTEYGKEELYNFYGGEYGTSNLRGHYSGPSKIAKTECITKKIGESNYIKKVENEYDYMEDDTYKGVKEIKVYTDNDIRRSKTQNTFKHIIPGYYEVAATQFYPSNSDEKAYEKSYEYNWYGQVIREKYTEDGINHDTYYDYVQSKIIPADYQVNAHQRIPYEITLSSFKDNYALAVKRITLTKGFCTGPSDFTAEVLGMGPGEIPRIMYKPEQKHIHTIRFFRIK